MNSLGLYTSLDMRKQSLDFMQANFGKAGSYYYWISRGINNREVRANRIRKSVGAENTFAGDLTEFGVMLSELQPLIDKVWRHCEDKGARPDGDAQGKVRRLRIDLAKPDVGRRDRQPRRVGIRVGRIIEGPLSVADPSDCSVLRFQDSPSQRSDAPNR
jgi:nucleotidyltransferase/DNA polymerase involved in DNA repair